MQATRDWRAAENPIVHKGCRSNYGLDDGPSNLIRGGHAFCLGVRHRCELHI